MYTRAQFQAAARYALGPKARSSAPTKWLVAFSDARAGGVRPCAVYKRFMASLTARLHM